MFAPLVFCAALASSADSSLSARIEAYIKPYVLDRQLSGTILVAKGDRVLFERSYGMANFELGVPNRANTSFNIASITKTITLIPVLQDAATHKLNPRATLKEFIPDFPKGEKITLLDLINHRSGIPHSVTMPADEVVSQNAESMTRLAAKAQLLFEPGTKEEYSSAGFSVLARVLELIEGKAYDEIIRDQVFRPAGMENSTSCLSQYFIKNRAPSYIQTLDGVWPSQPQDYSYLVGAGCINSTPRDLFKLLRAVTSGKLGEVVRKNLGDSPQIYWNGLTDGFRAFVQYDRADGVTVICCANTVTGAAERIREALPKIVRGQSVATPERLQVKKANLTTAQLAKFVGEYRIGNERFKMSVRDGYLLAGNTVLVPIAEDRFFAIRDYGEVRATWTTEGKVQKLDWYEGNSLIVTMTPVSS
ncbi:MAG: beta-lactamase family protein [Armatimonadetes bacterium]|nr:beta-lactamase family protein [Armatimonadota bacterium]